VEVLKSMLATRGMQMNGEQCRALRMSMEARDYLLLLGMPGTGKTATLAAIVIAAAARNQSVLICSHTRTAVDNVLSRLLDLGFTDFVRVGQRSTTGDNRIDDRHIDICDGTTTDELRRGLERPAVVATTCLGINHAVFSRRRSFDVVLVDEASQILQPICIGPLLLSSQMFVLVGDHYQLPPLLRSNASRNHHPAAPEQNEVRGSGFGEGLLPTLEKDSYNPQESLFRRLCEAHPSAVVSLVKQYRMAHEIMHLSNSLVYSGNLVCGTNDVANQRLDLQTDTIPESRKWLKAVLDPARRLLFIDTDGLNKSDRASTDIGDHSVAVSDLKAHKHAFSRENELEARVIAICVSALVKRGLHGKSVAVLTPFRAQVGVLRSILDESSLISKNGGTMLGLTGETPEERLASDTLRAVDVCTIDQYQGKDKSCVILSFVRIHTSESVGPLLKDWRRINVAITRARAKLVMVGSASAVAGGSHFLNSMMKTVQEQAAVIPVNVML
jgi:DNA replication ATP-dependent helicase Dna2